jgi:glutathione S-transferase
MDDLHIGNKNYSSWSLRPWVLMRELGLPFEERLHAFGHGSLKTFSPSGRVPCLVRDGFAVWDSLAITELLAEGHPRVWPADPRARAWARCAAAEMHSGFGALRNSCSMSVGQRVKLHEFSEPLQQDLARLDELWADGLTRFGGPFLAGAAFTAADAFFAPVAFRVQTYGLLLAEPSQHYVNHLLALPSMREWEAAALLEPWRDAHHEEEVRAAGTIVEDLRAPTA